MATTADSVSPQNGINGVKSAEHNTPKANFSSSQQNGNNTTNGINGADHGDSKANGPATQQRGGISGKGSDLKNAIKPSKPPGGFDTTPLPDAPQGYTLRFIFHYASNLPKGDISTLSSDPYLTATLKSSSPKRHKEDPDLVHRTPTLRNTTEPQWNDEWVVANVPSSGFTLKCRMYDEDSPDHDDRLGNVTLKIPRVYDGWEGIPQPGKVFEAKKRMISKRAFLLKGLSSLIHSDTHVTPLLRISVEVLGESDPPYAQMCTLGPARWTKHFSPMIGRMTGIKVNKDEEHDQDGDSHATKEKDKRSQKYE